MMFARGGLYGNNIAHCFGGFGMGGPVMMLIGLALLVFVGYMIYKSVNKQGHMVSGSTEAANEALDVLKMKFVNGEITEEEYLRKRNLLLK